MTNLTVANWDWSAQLTLWEAQGSAYVFQCHSRHCQFECEMVRLLTFETKFWQRLEYSTTWNPEPLPKRASGGISHI